MRNIAKSIDWKWIGISYLIAMIVFGLLALLKSDFDVMLTGIMFYSFFIVLGCLNIAAITVKIITANGLQLSEGDDLEH